MIYKNIKIILIGSIVTLLILSFAFLGVSNLFTNDKKDNDNAIKISDRKTAFIIEVLKKKYLLRNKHKNINNLLNIKKRVELYLEKKSLVINKIKLINLKIDRKDLIKNLKNIEYFKENHMFSKKKYSSFLNNFNISNEEFLTSFDEELLYLNFENTIKYSELLLKYHINNLFDIFKKSLNINYIKFNKHNQFREINVLKSDLYKYYKYNIENYKNPNRISFKYILLNMYQEMENINQETEYLKKIYTKYNYLYKDVELIKIQHIFLKEKNNFKIIKQQLFHILKQLKEGTKFSVLAEKYSKDFLTKKKGGNLGWIKKGESNLTFEKHIFNKSLKLNSVKLIMTKNGIHIIKVINKKNEEYKDFRHVKNFLKIHLKYEQAQINFEKKSKFFDKKTFDKNQNSLNSKLLFLDRNYYFYNKIVSDKIFKKNFILSKKIKRIFFLSDYVKIICKINQIKKSNYIHFYKVQNNIESKIREKKLKFFSRYKLENISKKLKNKNKNVINIKKSLLWSKITNVKRNNNSLNIEFLQYVFSKQLKKNYINLFINSNRNCFFINKKRDDKRNQFYNKHYSIYKQIENFNF